MLIFLRNFLSLTINLTSLFIIHKKKMETEKNIEETKS